MFYMPSGFNDHSNDDNDDDSDDEDDDYISDDEYDTEEDQAKISNWHTALLIIH